MPVASAVGVVVEELGLRVDVLVDRTAALNSYQPVSAQLRSVLVDGRRVLENFDTLMGFDFTDGKF